MDALTTASTAGAHAAGPVGPPIIRFTSVAKEFDTRAGKLLAARDINLSVAEGEFVTLVGPSGCGKSTLLNMIAGIFPASRGTVEYRGTPVTTYHGRVGYMTQNDHLLPWRDVAGNIAVPLEIRRTPRAQMRQRIEELIDELKQDYTIVIVTHNMQQAARVSDFTAFMYLGELIEFDSTTKIFTAPSDRRTQDYITGRFG